MDFKKAFLRGSSWYGNTKDLTLGTFDLGFFVPSWEERCTSITTVTDAVFGQAQMIKFDKSTESYEHSLDEFLHRRSRNVLLQISGSVSDLRPLGERILSSIRQTRTLKGQALSVFVDISCCPRYFLLYVLGACFRTGLCKSVSLFYGEGEYGENGGEFVFTEGDWELVTVPFFEGEVDPGRRMYYLVSVGFEGRKAFRMMSKLEPDRISVLLPYPGFNERYSQQVVDENAALIQEFSVPETQVIRVPAGDALGAWEATSALQTNPDENLSVICLGPKPHSLGIGLAAITNPRVQVLYCKPSMFHKRTVRPTGFAWFYQITDLSAI